MASQTAKRAGPFLRTPEAAAYCGYSCKHLARLRAEGRGPAWCKTGRIVLYAVSDLESWVLRHRRQPKGVAS